MDERADLKIILLDNQQMDWKGIKPCFPSYENMYIHIIENNKKMSKVAHKMSQHITCFVQGVQTPKICLAVVQNNGLDLKFVVEQTQKICLEAVQNNGLALEFVKNKTSEICLEAVQNNGLALEFVVHQTPKICLEAAQNNGLALEFVVEQTPEICLEAVKQNGNALQFVQTQTPEICMTAVQNNGLALEFVVEQTPEICLAAVQNNGLALKFVVDQTLEICLAAVLQTGCVLNLVENKTPENIWVSANSCRVNLSYINQTILYDGKVYKSFYYEQECNVYSKPLEERKLAWNSLQMLNRYLPSLPDDCMKRICLEIS